MVPPLFAPRVIASREAFGSDIGEQPESIRSVVEAYAPAVNRSFRSRLRDPFSTRGRTGFQQPPALCERAAKAYLFPSSPLNVKVCIHYTPRGSIVNMPQFRGEEFDCAIGN